MCTYVCMYRLFLRGEVVSEVELVAQLVRVVVRGDGVRYHAATQVDQFADIEVVGRLIDSNQLFCRR